MTAWGCYSELVAESCPLVRSGIAHRFVQPARANKPRTVKKSGFLGDYSMLSPGRAREKRCSFMKILKLIGLPTTRFFWPPVAYYGGRDTYPKGFTLADLQKLVNRFYYILYNDLAQDYQMVDEPAPHTLRIQMALTSVGGVLSGGGFCLDSGACHC